MTRCRWCRGSIWVYPNDDQTIADRRATVSSCLMCGRSPEAAAVQTWAPPAPPPLEGFCPNGHNLATDGYHRPDPRTASGYARHCSRCQEAAVEVLRVDAKSRVWGKKIKVAS